MSEVKFIFAYMVFFLFITQITALGSPAFFSGNVEIPNPPNCEVSTGWWSDVPVIAQAKILLDMLGCGWNNFTYFFTLMSFSSSITILGAILITPFVIVLMWLLVSWLRGR